VEDFAGAADPVTYTWDFGDGSPTEAGRQVRHIFTEPGAFTVTLVVRDDDGGETTESRSIRISDDSNPPNLDTGGPYVISEGESLVLDPTNTIDPLGRRLIYLWDLNADAITDVSSFSAITVSWPDLVAIQGSLANDGTLPLELLAASLFDSDVVLATTTLTIVNAPPVIETVSAPTDIAKGRQVVFAAAAKDPNPNDALSYAWNFGDGTTASGSTVTKAFATTGTFSVNLTVTDGDGGVASDTFAVQVTDRAPLTVDSVMRDDGSRFDLLDTYALTFSEDVSASLSADDLQIINSATSEVVDSAAATVVWDASTKTATWDLSGLGLAKGRYRLVIAAGAVQGAAGNQLDGNGDGSVGDDFSRDEVLTWQGDVNLDLEVGFSDFLVVAANFGVDGTNWSSGNFDGSPATDFDDFLALSTNFGEKAAASAVATAFADDDDSPDWWLS
jgi:PKD repeat protein